MDYAFMFDLADIKGTVESLRSLTLDMIEKADDYEPQIVLTLRDLSDALNDLDLMVPLNEIETQKKQQALEKLILSHQVMIAYRDAGHIDDKIASILNHLTKLYPLFLLFIAFDRLESVKRKVG